MRRVWVTAEESEGKSRFISGKSEITRIQAWHSGFAYFGGPVNVNLRSKRLTPIHSQIAEENGGVKSTSNGMSFFFRPKFRTWLPRR